MIPASWVIIIALIGTVASYILYVQWQRARAERKAAEAIQQRDNAVVEQQSTATAQAAEHAYQQAHDEAMGADEYNEKPEAARASLLSRLNNIAPLLLCLMLASACTPIVKTIEVNPAERVVIPASDPLDTVLFQKVGELHCLANNDAEALINNFKKKNARIKGLEAALSELGAKVNP